VAPPQRAGALDRLLSTDGPLLEHLGAQVLGGEPPEVRAFLRRVAPLRTFSPDLGTVVGGPDAPALVRVLARRGLFLAPSPAGREGLRLAPVLRALILDRDPLLADERDAVLHAAADWLAGAGRHADAVECLLDAGDGHGVARLLAAHGQTLLAAGGASTVLAAAAAVPATEDTPALRLLRAQAHQVCGEWSQARALYSTLAGDGPLPAALAWRLGSLAQLQGLLPDALATYERGTAQAGDTVDEALLFAWTATARWRQGDLDGCARATARALDAAASTGSDAAFAAAHTAAAMLAALAGDRAGNDHHYLLALDAAVRAGDVLQQIRIRTNRSSHFLDEGSYADAATEATLAIELGEASSVTVFRVIALVNRAEAALHLGRLEEAVADCEDARALSQRLGSHDLAYPLLRLGDISRERDDRSLAASSYREALALAEEVGDQQALVPALAGLARTLADEDPCAARELAQRAVDSGPGMGLVGALVALAIAELADSDPEAAATTAARALTAAGERRDRPGLAEALELRAAARPDAPQATAWLEEAVALWRALGSPLGLGRAELALAGRTGGLDGRILAEEAATALRAIGARAHAAAAERLLADLDGQAPAVAVQSLGGFRLLRSGVAVPLSDWQSRKARDLLKILVARRGRPTPRETVMAALWPGEDPERLAGRLSVQLSTLRTVLDPGRAHPAEHYIAAEDGLLRLELATVAVDVEAFLATAAAGLQRLAAGDRPAALTLLARAEHAYAGDFLEEDAGQHWSAAVREEARTTAVDVARALAGERARAGDLDGAARLYRRVLERDPYDEPAHLALVRCLRGAGRHGEARRRHAAYVAAMGDLGLEAAPFPTRPAPR